MRAIRVILNSGFVIDFGIGVTTGMVPSFQNQYRFTQFFSGQVSHNAAKEPRTNYDESKI